MKDGNFSEQGFLGRKTIVNVWKACTVCRIMVQDNIIHSGQYTMPPLVVALLKRVGRSGLNRFSIWAMRLAKKTLYCFSLLSSAVETVKFPQKFPLNQLNLHMQNKIQTLQSGPRDPEAFFLLFQ